MEGIYAAKVTFLDHKMAEMHGIYAALMIFLDHKMAEMHGIYAALMIFLDHKKLAGIHAVMVTFLSFLYFISPKKRTYIFKFYEKLFTDTRWL